MKVQKARLSAVARPVIAALAVGVFGAAAAAVSPGPAAAVTPTLPLSPPGRVSVLSVNATELLMWDDIAEPRDLVHLAARVQAVLTTLNSRGPAVPNYAPDIVLLQEVTHESTATIVEQLTAMTGRRYAVGADAYPGEDAWEWGARPDLIERETAIVFNAETMRFSQAAASLLEYPQADAIGEYIRLRAATLRLHRVNTACEEYGVYSAHYRTNTQVRNHDAYTVKWTNFLKKRVSELYTPLPTCSGIKVVPIIGGDFNSHSDAYLAPFRTSTSAGPGVYRVAQPQGSGSVDAIASTARC